MGHIHLPSFARLHARHVRLKARNPRSLRPIRPSRRAELAYRAELGSIVNHLRAAGHQVADDLRARWRPRVVDEAILNRDPLLSKAFRVVDETELSGLDAALARAAAKFGNIDAVAERLSMLAARRSLGEVDDRLAEEIRRSVSVDVTPLLRGTGAIAEAMAIAAEANAALITSIPAQYLADVRGVVVKAFAAGMRWESMVDEIKARGDVADNRARVIARDQTSKMNASFNEVRQRSLGIEHYEWSGALDQRERDSHRRMEGSLQRWDSPPLVDGERVHPGQAILCRCLPRPRFDLDEIAGGGQRAEAA